MTQEDGAVQEQKSELLLDVTVGRDIIPTRLHIFALFSTKSLIKEFLITQTKRNTEKGVCVISYG